MVVEVQATLFLFLFLLIFWGFNFNFLHFFKSVVVEETYAITRHWHTSTIQCTLTLNYTLHADVRNPDGAVYQSTVCRNGYRRVRR